MIVKLFKQNLKLLKYNDAIKKVSRAKKNEVLEIFFHEKYLLNKYGTIRNFNNINLQKMKKDYNSHIKRIELFLRKCNIKY